jgi:hypothetical protein
MIPWSMYVLSLKIKLSNSQVSWFSSTWGLDHGVDPFNVNIRFKHEVTANNFFV